MKKLPEVRTPFRFVTDENDLNRNQVGCKGACEYALIMPTTYLMDFMLIREASADPITSMTLSSADGGHVISTDFTGQDMKENPIIKNFGEFDHIFYRGVMATGHFEGPLSMLSEPMKCDQLYYVRISDGTNNWISEPIQPVAPDYVDEVQNGILNGTFDTDLSEWIVSGAWTWNAGRARKAPGAPATLQQYIAVQFRDDYLDSFWNVEFDIYGLPIGVFGTVSVKYDGLLIGSITVADLRDVQHVCISGSFQPQFLLEGKLEITGDANFDGDIDNVEIRPLSWDLYDHAKLEWTDTCDVGNIINSWIPIIQRFWFKRGVDIGEPLNTFLEEGTENGDKVFLPSFQKQTTADQLMSELLPKYVINALSDIGFYSSRTYTRPEYGGYSNILSYSFTYGFEFDEKCFASALISMQLSDAIIKTSCCLPPTDPCPVLCASVIGFLPVSPVEGGWYVQNGNRDIIEYHSSGSTTPQVCASPPKIPAVIFDGLATYYYDGTFWRPICQIAGVVNSEEGGLTYAGSTAFTLLGQLELAGATMEIFWSPDGVTWTSIGEFTQAECNMGISFDEGVSHFYLQTYISGFGCGPFQGLSTEVILGRFMAYDYSDPQFQFGPGTWYKQIFDAVPNIYDLNTIDQISLDDDVALLAKLISLSIPSTTWVVDHIGTGITIFVNMFASYADLISWRRADTTTLVAQFTNLTRIQNS